MDLFAVSANWKAVTDASHGDLNGSGGVEAGDLLALADRWHEILAPIEMLPVPAGSFVMGALDGWDDRHFAGQEEYPRHQVHLPDYWIGKYEITLRQFADTLNWAFDRGLLEADDGAPYRGGRIFRSGVILAYLEKDLFFDGGRFEPLVREGNPMADHPVGGLTWFGAVSFCNWRSQMEGLPVCYSIQGDRYELTNPTGGGYRLPSEAEWERAAAWGQGRHFVYAFQSQEVGGTRRCNYYGPNWGNPLYLSAGPFTSPVGWYNGINIHQISRERSIDSRSPVGCYDMSGNILEWCEDWFHSSYIGAPTDGSAWLDPDLEMPYRILRGGPWSTFYYNCRTSTRFRRPPNIASSTGLRVVRTAPPDPVPEIREIRLPNLPPESRPLRVVRIPPGSFLMGSPASEQGREANEGPQRAVRIDSSYFLGETEITQAQWKAVMGTDPSAAFGFSGPHIGPDVPVFQVAWEDCQEFVEALNRLGPGTFRLPSEAEWEHACRARSWTRYSSGDILDCGDGCQACEELDAVAVWCGSGGGSPEPVASHLPNAFGLYDMHGNEWEWCQDYYHSSLERTPLDGSPRLDPPSGPLLRSARGGNWESPAPQARSASRVGLPPNSLLVRCGLRIAWTPR
jgi:formylglycine-generating enzyme required for sulfatase activity